MREKILKEIETKFEDWLYNEPIFKNPMEMEDDCFSEYDEYEEVMNQDGIKVWLEYEYENVYIAGLTEEEQKYLEEYINGRTAEETEDF